MSTKFKVGDVIVSTANLNIIKAKVVKIVGDKHVLLEVIKAYEVFEVGSKHHFTIEYLASSYKVDNVYKAERELYKIITGESDE